MRSFVATDCSSPSNPLVPCRRSIGSFARAVESPSRPGDHEPPNPWLGLVLDAVSAQIGRPVPPPGRPGPFALDNPGILRGLLTAAGFSQVNVTDMAAPMRIDSFDEWWRRTPALAGPLAHILADMSAEDSAALAIRVREAVRPYQKAHGGLEFPGLALVASGSRT